MDGYTDGTTAGTGYLRWEVQNNERPSSHYLDSADYSYHVLVYFCGSAHRLCPELVAHHELPIFVYS